MLAKGVGHLEPRRAVVMNHYMPWDAAPLGASPAAVMRRMLGHGRQLTANVLEAAGRERRRPTYTLTRTSIGRPEVP